MGLVGRETNGKPIFARQQFRDTIACSRGRDVWMKYHPGSYFADILPLKDCDSVAEAKSLPPPEMAWAAFGSAAAAERSKPPSNSTNGCHGRAL